MGHEQEGTQLSGTASGAIFQCLCPKLHSWGVKSPHCLFQAHCSTGGAGLQQVAGRGQPKVRAIAVSEGIFLTCYIPSCKITTLESSGNTTQSPFNKVLQWTFLVKYSLRFGLVGQFIIYEFPGREEKILIPQPPT